MSSRPLLDGGLHFTLHTAGVCSTLLRRSEAAAALRPQRGGTLARVCLRSACAQNLGGQAFTGVLCMCPPHFAATRPAEIEVCKRPDGSDWVLGSGAFGRVSEAGQGRSMHYDHSVGLASKKHVSGSKGSSAAAVAEYQ